MNSHETSPSMDPENGEKSAPRYEDWELERGFEIEWFDNLDTAIETISQNEATEPGMAVLQERDLAFLKKAKEKLTLKDSER